MFCLISKDDPTMLDALKNDIAIADAQKTMTIICVTYLLFNEFETGFCPTDDAFEERLRSYPLYDYAARNWGHHARAPSIAAEPLILSFLNSEAKLSACSQAMFASKLFPSHSNYSQDVPRHMRGVHVAAYFGLEEIIKSLPKRSKSPDLKDSYGRTALSYAAENGHKMLVKLLLATSKVDANTQDERGRSPLSYAAANGHAAVVKLLLGKGGVDADLKDTRYSRTPLSYAAEYGHEVVVKLLFATER